MVSIPPNILYPLTHEGNYNARIFLDRMSQIINTTSNFVVMNRKLKQTKFTFDSQSVMDVTVYFP